MPTLERTMLGAYITVPTASEREIRKRTLASRRVGRSKRRSRYSYAVKTRALWNHGTTVAHRTTIANGIAREKWRKRIPWPKPWPVVEIRATALAGVAVTDRPMAPQLSGR